MPVISPERARDQLAMMYVNKSQGITAVRLVDDDGERILVVDILSPFWHKVGGTLPKTWAGLDVYVSLHDVTGGAYPWLINLRESNNVPASPFADDQDAWPPRSPLGAKWSPPPRRSPLGAKWSPPRQPEPPELSMRRILFALVLMAGGSLLAESGIGWVAAGFLLSGLTLGSGIVTRRIVEDRVLCIFCLLMLAMCAAGTYAFFAVGSGLLAWVLGAIVAFATGQLAGMFLRNWWAVLNEDPV